MAEAAPDVEVLGLADVAPYPEPAETERTFAGNALLKARACVAATGLPALADDSGLEVDVLNGMPGVRSARWAGPEATDADNNELLLRQLHDVPPTGANRALRLRHGRGASRTGPNTYASASCRVTSSRRRGVRMASATTRCSWPRGTP